MSNQPPPLDFDPYRPLDQSMERGDAINRWILRRPRQKIVDLLKGQRVLDVCCGTGNLTAMLAEAGCSVTGVDRSATMLAHARRKPIRAEFRALDASRLPYDREFDAAVISIALHEMAPDMRIAVWESMRGAVRPGGRLVALDFAIPQKNTFPARLAARLIEQDERGMESIHPEHYANYREFMQTGGLLAWVQRQGGPVEAEYRFLAGTLAVVVVRVG